MKAVVAAAPYLSELKLASGYSPFMRHIATSAVVAGLLVKFSSFIAPEWGIQATSWIATYLYLYFALGRAAFIRTHCIGDGKGLDPQSLARGAMAFNVAVAREARSFAVFGAVCLGAGAAFDVLIAAAASDARDAVHGTIVLAGLIGWATWCPRFLVASGLWAVEGSFSLRRARHLARHAPGRLWAGWLVAVGVNAAVSIGAFSVLYVPLRTIVVMLIPSGTAIYFFSAAFHAAVIAFQLTLQAAFAAWIAPLLLAEQEAPAAARSLERGEAASQSSVSTTLRQLAGTTLCLTAAALLGAMLLLNRTMVEARVTVSQPTCIARWVGPGKGALPNMSCSDLAARPQPGVQVVEGAVLALTFRDAEGRERRAMQFFPKHVASRAVREGHLRIVYDPRTMRAAPSPDPALWIGIGLLIGGLGAGLLGGPRLRRWIEARSGGR